MSDKSKIGNFPKPEDLEQAILESLITADGELSTKKMFEMVVLILQPPREILLAKRLDGREELKYRLAWARTKAKNKGLIEHVRTSAWGITPLGRNSIQR